MYFFPGDPVLRTSMAVEKLGGWQDPRPHDGPGHWGCPGRGEAAEEAIAPRLPR